MSKKLAKFSIFLSLFVLGLSSCSTQGAVGPQGEQGIPGEKGQDGSNGRDGVDGKDGSNGRDGVDGKDGSNGVDGKNGKDGVSVVSITKTGEDEETGTDTYTILYSDNSTSTFTVTNGKDGQSIKGDKGNDGHTPEITIGQNGHWYIDGVDSGIKATGDNGHDAPHYGETHIVTFHLNGGSFATPFELTQTVSWGDTIELPIPTKEHFYFAGWFTGETVNDRHFTSSDAVFTDLDLYANYVGEAYKITLDLDGGTYYGARKINANYMDEYALPDGEEVTKENKVLAGWFLDGDRWDYTGTYKKLTDIILKAKWVNDVTYGLTIDKNDGGVMPPVAFNRTAVELYSEPLITSSFARDNYQFVGIYHNWTKVFDSDGKLVVDDTYFEVYSNCILIARYIGNSEEYIGDFKIMGEYPQSEVKDTALINQLKKVVDEDGDSFITYENEKYKVVEIEENSVTNTYFYSFDPILWKINKSGIAMPDRILDVKPFMEVNVDDKTPREYQGNNHYITNYYFSSIRAFLNGYDSLDYNDVFDYIGKGFIDIAFTDAERQLILESVIDNSNEQAYIPKNGSNSYFVGVENTSDKIFLLSYKELSYIGINLNKIDRGSNQADIIQQPSEYVDRISNLGNNNEKLSNFYWTRCAHDWKGDQYITTITKTGAVTNNNAWDKRGIFPCFYIDR